MSILAIDDEIGVARLCERYLTKIGHQVIATNHLNEVILLSKSLIIDLILVDIRIAEIDNYLLLNRIRKSQPEIAVVITTGFGTVDKAVGALHQGANGVLLKPFSETELVQSVQLALRKRQSEQEGVRLQALQPLFAISEKLFIEKSSENLRSNLLEMVKAYFDCAHVSFYQRNTFEDYWEQLAFLGNPFDLFEYISDIRGMREPNTFIYEGADCPTLVDLPNLDDFGLCFCLPLDSEIIQRFIFAARKKEGSELSEVEQETLKILSRQAVVALDNAQLYDELQAKISQVEESQRALIQAEKMAAVGRLTASIAHEINNPLHSLQNCLHLARRNELSLPDREAYLEKAFEETERLMRTVRQMLDFYRPSALERKPSNINKIILGVLKLLGNQLTDNEVSINLQLEKNLPMVLTVDNQIKQVFFNLILNALEAMPNGGEIRIISLFDQENVSIIIKDSGSGITSIPRDDIFEPFISTKEKGLGLGLTVSYGIVTAHGGSLVLMPPSDGGASFKLSLPIDNYLA